MRALRRVLIDSWTRFNEHGDVLAAGMSFYALLSVAPLIVIATTLAGWVFGRESARAALLAELGRLGNADLQNTARKLIAAANAGGGRVAAIVAGFALLIAASRLFIQVQDALNLIWGVTIRPAASTREALSRLLHKRLLSFVMVVGCGALLLVAIVVQGVATALGSATEGLLGTNSVTSALAFVAQTGVTFVLGAVAFTILYRVLPDVRLGWSHVWVGGMLTSALMLLGTWLLGLYLSLVAPAWLQGAIGSVAVFMVWTYYQAQVFLFGAALTRAWSARKTAA